MEYFSFYSYKLTITGWAMIINIGKYYTTRNWLLFSIGIVVFILEIWMIIESVIMLSRPVKAALEV